MTLLGGIDTGQDPQKCRLAGAVDAHHPDPVTGGDREGQPFEQHLVDPANRYLLEIDEDSHELSRVPVATSRPSPAPLTARRLVERLAWARLLVVAFGQQSGPPASARQIRELLALLNDAGHTDFRDARGPMGFTQRQAAGKFTVKEAEAFIDGLQNAEAGAASPVTDPEASLSPAQRAMRRVPAEQLAAELQRRGWTVTEPPA
jgi:hypothetical protein